MATTINVILADSTTAITVSTGARGPAGTSAANSVTSATTSDGTAALYLDSIRFESSNGGPTQLGEMAWESTDGSIDAQLENGVIAAIGEDGLIRVRNTSGVPIAKGDALRYTGTNGATGRLEVAKWVGANVSNAKTFMGFAACAMNDNSNGYAQWFGKLEGITTTGGGEAWIDGQIIYAVPGTSATITDTAPTAAGEYVVAAAVINAGSGTSGSMFVRPSFAKNIASADIVDASDFGATAGSGKVVLFGGDGQISAPYFFAAGFPDVPNATYGISSIETLDGDALPAATMNFPTTGSGTLMLGSNNLSDLSSASTARTNLGAGATGSSLFTAANAQAVDETLLGQKSRKVLSAVYESDFLSIGAGAEAFPGLNTAVIGGGVISNQTSRIDANHPGVILFQDSTTVNGGVRIGSSSVAILIAGGETAEFVFRVESARTTQTIRLGFDDSASATDPVDGVWLNMVGNGSDVIVSGKTASNAPTNAISTTATTYTLAVSTWVSATVVVNSNATLVTYTLRNESGTVLWTDTLATTIPTGAGRNTSLSIIATESTSDAATTMMHLDYARFSINRLLTR